MSFVGQLIGRILRPILERQAKGRTPESFRSSLEYSGSEVAERLAQAPDTPHNREITNHIVGIERWGTQRLRVALGEPLVLDSYRGYRLPEDSDIAALRHAFAETRGDTRVLVSELGSVDPTLKTMVRHNDLGELSVGGWLAYLGGMPSAKLVA